MPGNLSAGSSSVEDIDSQVDLEGLVAVFYLLYVVIGCRLCINIIVKANGITGAEDEAFPCIADIDYSPPIAGPYALDGSI